MTLEQREGATKASCRWSDDSVEFKLMRRLPDPLARCMGPREVIEVEPHGLAAIGLPQVQDLRDRYVAGKEASRADEVPCHPLDIVHKLAIGLGYN